MFFIQFIYFSILLFWKVRSKLIEIVFDSFACYQCNDLCLIYLTFSFHNFHFDTKLKCPGCVTILDWPCFRSCSCRTPASCWSSFVSRQGFSWTEIFYFSERYGSNTENNQIANGGSMQQRYITCTSIAFCYGRSSDQCYLWWHTSAPYIQDKLCQHAT